MLNNRVNLVFCVILSWALQGCTFLSAQSRADPRSVAVYKVAECPLTKQQGDTRLGSVDLDCFKFPGASEVAYTAATDKMGRNRLLSALMKHSDDACTFVLGKMYSDEATINTSLGVLATGFSTAATIVSGEQAKTILSGVSSLAGASRDHINVNVYRSQISSALSQAINNKRSELRAQILAKYTLTPVQWSIDDGIRDVNLYHQECSFYRGIELVLMSVQDKKALQSYISKRDTELVLSAAKATLVELSASRARLVDATAQTNADKAIADLQTKISTLEQARLDVLTNSGAAGATTP